METRAPDTDPAPDAPSLTALGDRKNIKDGKRVKRRRTRVVKTSRAPSWRSFFANVEAWRRLDPSREIGGPMAGCGSLPSYRACVSIASVEGASASQEESERWSTSPLLIFKQSPI